MKPLRLVLGVLAVLAAVPALRADSLWERRNPYHAYLFKDTRARKVGDVLTVVIREATLFDGKEDRKMNKNTKAAALFSLKGAFSGTSGSGTSFSGDADGLVTSQRELTGKADYKSDRTFLDRMSVMVVGVMPNGNLIVEGYRERVVQYERKLLKVSGVVRPIDIGSDNAVESQFIANFEISYVGRGPESRFTNHNWLGKIVNVVWPF